MYCLITDETNIQSSKSSKFYIYGGLIFSPEQMVQVSSNIAEIRQQYGFESGHQLKFDTNCRPAEVSREDYTSAKNAVIEACNGAGVSLSRV